MPITSLYIKPGTPPSTNQPIKIEGIVGGTITVFPEDATTHTGIEDGSDTISSPAFENSIVEVSIGGVSLPQVNPGTPDMWYTKNYDATDLVLSENLADGDLIKILIYR